MTDDARSRKKSETVRGCHVLVAGGGSGGHVFPGLAVADELVARGCRVSWAGRAGGLEQAILRRREMPFYPVAAKAVVGRGRLAQAGALATLAGAAWGARRLVREQRIDAVVGTGGYVSAPAVVGGRLARRPALLLEPNAEAGAANRFLSWCAQGAAVAFPETARALRCPARHTGVPVRSAFFEERDAPPGERLRMLVLGGSQGARQLNELLPAALERAAGKLPPVTLLHQVGERHLEEARAAYADRQLGEVELEILPFVDDVAGAMARSHLVVSRAGAVTLAEICAAGRAALLVPLTLAGGHQLANAERLAAAGAARVLGPGAATVEAWADELVSLLGDRDRLAEMGRAAAALARPEAAREIADMVVEMAEAA